MSKSDKPSRFLIELKSEIDELRDKEEVAHKKKGKNYNFEFFVKIRLWLLRALRPKTKVFNVSEKQKKTIRSVAFYPILKLVFKFSGVFAWLVHFFFRFVYFFIKIVVRNFKLPIFFKKSIKEKVAKKISHWSDAAYIPDNKILGSTKDKNILKKRFCIKDIFSKLCLKNFKLNFSLDHFKKIFYFSLVLFVLIIPFKVFYTYSNFDISSIKGRVLGASEDASSNLVLASRSVQDLDFIGAQDGFVRAGDDLLNVKIELEKINNGLFFLASFIPNQKIQIAAEGKKIIEAGILGTAMGDNFSLAINSFSKEDISLTSRLEEFKLNIGLARENILELYTLLESIDVDLFPEEYRSEVVLIKKSLFLSDPLLLEIYDLTEKFIIFLGGHEDKRYLFVFQNNSELRASGGFIGSFALVDLSDGKIKNMEVPGGGSYDTEGGLRDFIIAPEPLHLVNPLWHFWDANWWPDFKKTAQKLMWFYERSGGPSVDGVISLTPTVLENLLELIGPIDMSDEYGLIIDSDNFWIETQSLAEQKEDVTNTPKKIIGDLMDKIFEELPRRIDKDNIFDFTKVILETLNEKQILFYFEDDELQNKAREYSWSGEIKDTISDYLMVVNTNIAGAKSDRVIKQKISHNVEIRESGEIYDTVVVERKHEGVEGELFTGERNNSWMRFYVPLGSELIKAQGFWPIDESLFEKPEDTWDIDPDLIAEREAYIDTDSWTKIYAESGKTVFANWAWVNPGESVTVSIKYKLPFKIDFEEDAKEGIFEKIISIFSGDKNKLAPYSLMIQKQAGTSGDVINSLLNVEGGQEIVWAYGIGDSYNIKGWDLRG